MVNQHMVQKNLQEDLKLSFSPVTEMVPLVGLSHLQTALCPVWWERPSYPVQQRLQ